MKFLIPDEHKNASGVYIIRNSVNGKVYIGSAKNFKRRFASHKTGLVTGKHHSVKLQNHIRKYGIECLCFDILEICDLNNLFTKEQYYIDYYESYKNNKGFNTVAIVFPSPIPTKEMKEKRLIAWRSTIDAKRAAGIPISTWSEESRAKMGERLRGPRAPRITKPCIVCGMSFTTTVKKEKVFCSNKCSAVNRSIRTKGISRSKESIAKGAEKLKGSRRSQEAIEKTRAKRIGVPVHSAEAKEKFKILLASYRTAEVEEKRKEASRIALKEKREKRIAQIPPCVICGKQYNPTRSRQKYCSHECARKKTMSEQTRDKRRAAMARFYTSEAMVKRRIAQNEARKRMCEFCNDDFLANYPGEVRRFCSMDCRCKAARK